MRDVMAKKAGAGVCIHSAARATGREGAGARGERAQRGEERKGWIRFDHRSSRSGRLPSQALSSYHQLPRLPPPACPFAPTSFSLRGHHTARSLLLLVVSVGKATATRAFDLSSAIESATLQVRRRGSYPSLYKFTASFSLLNLVCKITHSS